MSWSITAAVVTSIGSSYYEGKQADKAAKEATQQAKEDRADALRAEQFAETEGEGQGSLGNISLSVDDEVDTDLSTGAAHIAV